MIKAVNLQKKYSTDEVETRVLKKVNLQINPGEFVAIMGPSGCGKSTLLNILGLIDYPTAGELYFNGQNVAGYTENQRADLRKKNIGFVFQSFNLMEELTVYENIELPLIYQKLPSAEISYRVNSVMEKLQLLHRRNHFPQQLSGGQQQRVAIARAVVSSPLVILADEPTGNLDSITGQEVMNLLAELNETGTTIIMVTHSPTDAEYSHRIIRLFDGEVITENRNKPAYAEKLL